MQRKKKQSKCNCERKRKHLAYGQKKKKFWCDFCDANLVPPVNKGSERQKVKKEIKKELEDNNGKDN